MSSTEEPRLVWFELEVCPFRFRLAAVEGQVVVYGFRGEDGQIRSMQLPYQGSELRIRGLLDSLHWLVMANGIMEMPEANSDAAFVQRNMAMDSVHIRVAYSDESVWTSAFPLAAVPPNVQALMDQVSYLAAQEFQPPTGAASQGAE